TDWQAGTPTTPGETPRGFTGHEHLDGVGLIHMNGRVYDPTLGRFLSADPNVQAPDDTQSFNRYSYVKNNPLSYTDPSGFFFKKIFKKIASVFKKAFKAAVSFVKRALQNQFVQVAIQIGINFIPGIGQLGALALSAAFSGLVTLANGGDLGQALLAAGITVATAVLTAGVTKLPGLDKLTANAVIAVKAVAHGAIGGVTSIARGGKFVAGFAASAFGSLSGAVAGRLGLEGPSAIAFAAVSGGIGAELGGGKFKNGAFSGAFSVLATQVASASSPSSPQEEGLLIGGRGDDVLIGACGLDCRDSGRTFVCEGEGVCAGEVFWGAVSLAVPVGGAINGGRAVWSFGLRAADELGGLAGSLATSFAGVLRSAGPLKQWIRFGNSYSRTGGFKTSFSIKWGASPKFIQQIPSVTLQRLNRWVRGLKLPGNGWRTRDPGHFHIKK
uniref:RHS repeat-associated core domain-containing protein n=1 Tax=Pelagibius sp. Alg239-R121 TaxID=2993448 RepID=UPI0024A67658